MTFFFGWTRAKSRAKSFIAQKASVEKGIFVNEPRDTVYDFHAGFPRYILPIIIDTIMMVYINVYIDVN